MLGQDVQGTGPQGLAVQLVFGDALPGRLALQGLEPVGGHEEGAAGLVEAMVGPADPLHHPAGALGRGQLDDQVHVAPVDAEVQGGGADHSLQLAPGHGRLDLSPLLWRQAAVVQGDGQAVVVQLPELLEGELCLEAGVDEDQGRPRRSDGLVDLGHGVLGGMPRPGRTAIGQQQVHLGRGAGRAADQVHGPVATAHPPADDVRVVHRRRQADAPQPRRQGRQAGEAQGQEVSALGGVQGVDFVDDDAGKVLEIEARAFPGAEQGQLLGGGQQDVGGPHLLPLAAGDPGVPRPALGGDVQPHLPDRSGEVALDVHGQGLER